jgi:hypothetical protein
MILAVGLAGSAGEVPAVHRRRELIGDYAPRPPHGQIPRDRAPRLTRRARPLWLALAATVWQDMR